MTTLVGWNGFISSCDQCIYLVVRVDTQMHGWMNCGELTNNT